MDGPRCLSGSHTALWHGRSAPRSLTYTHLWAVGTSACTPRTLSPSPRALEVGVGLETPEVLCP